MQTAVSEGGSDPEGAFATRESLRLLLAGNELGPGSRDAAARHPAPRHRFMVRFFLVSLLALCALLIAGVVDSLDLRVERVLIQCPALPPEADGLTIAQLSDLHIHPSFHRIEECTRLLTGIQAHLLAMTGDFRLAGGSSDVAVQGTVRIVQALGGRMPVYAVQGNNDLPETMQDLRLAGIRVLDDEAEPIMRGLWVVGWNPYRSTPASLATVVGLLPREAGYILLAHSPDVVLEKLPRDPILILSGHTHGIQIQIPGVPSPMTRTRVGRLYTRGLYDLGGSFLYINRGIGTTMVPLRVYSSPEITVLTLRRPT